ncbi:tetratricopeptide repeat protein [Candidatus Harpocratesius sp.]
MPSLFKEYLNKIREYLKRSQFMMAKDEIEFLQSRNDLTPSQNDEIFLLQAQLANQTGKFSESLRILKNLSENFAFSSESLEYMDLLYLLGDNYFRLGNFSEALGYIQEALDLFEHSKISSNRQKIQLYAKCIIVKAGILWQTGKLELALKNLEKMILNQRDLLEPVHLIKLLNRYGVIICAQGNYSEGIKYFDEALQIARSNHYPSLISILYNNLGMIYRQLGNFKKSLIYCEKSLIFENRTGNTFRQATVLDTLGELYFEMGKYSEASEYFLQSVNIGRKLGNPYELSVYLFHLIKSYIELNQISRCKKFLTEFEMLCLVEDNIRVIQRYQLIQALLWKKSSQLRFQFQAHEILQSIAFGPVVEYEITLTALVHLADILLDEMRVTQKGEIVEEIEPIIAELLKIAESQNLILLLAQTYLLKARFAILTLNIDQARQFLTKAQNYAMSHHLNGIAIQIASEHDKLLEQQLLLEQIGNKEISIEERLKLSGFNLQFSRMIVNTNDNLNTPSKEIPIFFAIMNECGPMIFSQQFNREIVVNDQLFGGLLSAFYSYCSEMTEHSFDRAKFGHYTIMLVHNHSLLFAYVYKGSSYSAQKRLNLFLDKLKTYSELWNQIQNSVNLNNVLPKSTLQLFLPVFHSSFPEILMEES